MSKAALENRFMEFRLGSTGYAVPLLSVKEVIQKTELTPVPNMPSHFEGMMNLRGQILGVYSVRKKLNQKLTKDNQKENNEVVMVIEVDGFSVGMLVDEVTRVLHASEETIKPAPIKEGDPAGKFITAVIQSENELVLTVDIGALLELDKIKHAQKAA